MQRILHLNSLEKQIKNNLRFPEKKQKENKKEEFDFDIDTLEDLDLNDSMFSDDF